MLRRTTLCREVCLQGIGLHTGEPINLVLRPNPRLTGIVYQRSDLPGQPSLVADWSQVSDTERGTNLKQDACLVRTVEHLMAALYASRITDVLIEVNGSEIPATDGSAYPFMQLLRKAGRFDLGESMEPLRIESPLWVQQGESHLMALPFSRLKVTCFVDHSHPLAGQQSVSLNVTPASFRTQLSPARTYGFYAEVEDLHRRGLARGGSFENALILYDDHYSSALRFENELVRHKALDLVGDLALLGRPLEAHVIAVKGSHKLNIEMVRIMSREMTHKE